MGVWIEIVIDINSFTINPSLPAWECGLKFALHSNYPMMSNVTPCVGVWIEIIVVPKGKIKQEVRHSLRGSVD